MTQDLTKNSQFEEDIDLRETIKTILENKILIILFIFIFTLTAIFYSQSLKPSFKSSTLIEIGYIEMPDGSRKLFETPSNLISNIKVDLVYKDSESTLSQKVNFEALEDKLIKFNLTSNSAELNEEELTKFLRYIDERHNSIKENIFNQLKDKPLEQELEELKLKSTINDLKNNLKVFEQKVDQLKGIIAKETVNLNLLKSNPEFLIKRTALIPTLDQIIYDYEKEMIEIEANKIYTLGQISTLEKNLKLLETNKIRLENQKYVNTTTIGDIKTHIIEPKTKPIILLGFVFGLFAGIFIVLIKNFIKKFRND